MNYILEKGQDTDFDLIVVKLTHESLFDFIEDLEAEDQIKNQSGTLLIDQLFSTGKNKNRFLEMPYEDGRIKTHQAKLVEEKPEILKVVVRVFKENASFLDSSILNDEEIKEILDGTE